MRLLLNLVWLVLAGFWMFVGYLLAAALCVLFVVTIPFAVPAVRIGLFALWPFGRRVVKTSNAGAGSFVGNLIWFVIAGWWLTLGHLVTAALLCLSIIGIPLGLANLKLVRVSLAPYGRVIVPVPSGARAAIELRRTVGRSVCPARPLSPLEPAAGPGPERGLSRVDVSEAVRRPRVVWAKARCRLSRLGSPTLAAARTQRWTASGRPPQPPPGAACGRPPAGQGQQRSWARKQSSRRPVA